VEATEATRALYHLYTDALGVTPALLPRMVALSEAFLDGFSGAIAEARDLGEIDRPIDPERKALLIFAVVRGIALQFLLDGDERRLRASERDLVAEVRSMMRRNPK
jgi:inactivated superfamily I helicase